MTDHTEPTPPTMQVFYTDDGILLGWHPDPDDPAKLRTVALNVDDAVSVAATLHETARDGEDRARNRFAVSTTADGQHVALLWAGQDHGQMQALLIPRDAVPALTAAMWQAVDDRDELKRHDMLVADADPDDFS